MYRSRLSLLAIVVASACTTRGDAKGTEILSQDPALAAGLQDHQKAQQLALPDVCGSIATVVQPTVAAKHQAQDLARRAYDAELVGNADSARSLLARAAQLDATDRSAAYHLGRASETLGDRTAAMTAYCRYIALTPTMTESAEARQRVAALARETRVAAGSASYVVPVARRVAAAPVRRASHARSTLASRAVDATVERRMRVASSERATSHEGTTSRRHTYSTNGTMDGADGAGVAAVGASASPSVEQSATPTTPAAPAPTVNRGPSRMQTAGIGAIAGAIMGAAVGRNVKSAVIGAAAGAVMGTVVGGTTRSTGRSLRR